MNTRQRFKAIMNFQPFDRLPILEWASWWDKTLDRWHGKGLPPEITDRYDICRNLGRFLVSCDHQTPPGVSLEQYRIYLNLFREYAKKAGQLSSSGLNRQD